MPKWNPRNLQRHYKKRITEDAGCFESLDSIKGNQFTEALYFARTCQAYKTAQIEYDARSSNGNFGYYNTARYFVDDELVVAIVDRNRDEFCTCYHEHFGRPHGHDPRPETTVGQKIVRYREHVNAEEKCGMIIELRRLRGF